MFKSVFSLSVVLVIFSCGPIRYNSEVFVSGKENKSVYTFTAKGAAKKQEKAIYEAEKNAFRVIMFTGVPGTDLSMPLVGNENEAMNNHKNYFDRFFNQNAYTAFVLNRSTVTSSKKIRGGYEATVSIKVNIESLRTDLEQNEIIRKFGY